MCKITVLMTVKNGQNYLAECVESVLNQTFTDFEFLIFDDNSTDNTLDILNSYDDQRIKIHKGTNYIANLNTGIEIAKAEFIARMDHDDIMVPEKLAIQYIIMKKTDVAVCGSQVYLFGENYLEPYLEILEYGLVKEPLKALGKVNFIHHSTVVLRKQFLMKHKLRYEPYFPADDYKLWIEIAKKGGQFYMFPHALLYYRVSDGQCGMVLLEEGKRLTQVLQEEIRDYLAQVPQ